MQKLLNLTSTWLHWGVASQTDWTLKRKVFHTNVTALIAILSLVFYSAYLVAAEATLMVTIVVPELVLCGVLATVPWLNLKGRDGLARWVLALTAMSSQLVSIFAGFGSYLNSHFYFVLFAILPVAFFPIKQWLSIILLFVVNFALYLAFEYHGMAPSAEVFALSDTTVRVLRASYATTTVLTMFVLIWLFEMVSEKNERELESVSHTDPLTKLPNRRLFEQVLRQEMAKSRRNQQPLVIAMLDIDRFKLINDTYGHGVGDDVLKHLSLHLRNTTRTGNVIARVGGEEFALLLPHTSVPEALEVVERLRRVVQDNGFPLKGQMLTITVSIGVAMVDCDMPPERSTQLADEALYTAKRAGRNRVVAHGTPD